MAGFYWPSHIFSNQLILKILITLYNIVGYNQIVGLGSIYLGAIVVNEAKNLNTHLVINKMCISIGKNTVIIVAIYHE